MGEEGLLAAQRPGQGQLHALKLDAGAGAGVRAVVEAEDEVSSQAELVLDRTLGRQQSLAGPLRQPVSEAPLRDRGERNPARQEGVDLETARIGGDGTVPAHERVQSAELLDAPNAGRVCEVERVDHERPDSGRGQLLGGDRLDNAAGAVGEEGRQPEQAVRGRQR